MNSDTSLFLDDQNPDSAGAGALSIALIGPDESSRKAAIRAISRCQGGEIREYLSYPNSLDALPRLLEQRYDVIVIDLDSDPEYALELVEGICIQGAATVMVYSTKSDSDLLVRCMRAGAREFLSMPFAEGPVAEALDRAASRRPGVRPQKKANGRLLAFLGAKGGDGVTTLACNFAVALAQESEQRTLLIDLDLPLGDAALNLGVVAEYSAINALQNIARLDSSFLSKLLVKHSTGVSVLAAPGKFPQFDAPNESIDKLLTVARQEFDNVVIDLGSRLDLMGAGIFKEGATIYLVIQAGIAGLRNANRLISQYFSSDVPQLEIVLNRYQPRDLGVAEDRITKALTRPAQWKIPNDFAAVRRMQHTAIPLALEDSPISRLIHQMARSVCGLPPAQEKGSGFSFKKIGKSLTSRISSSEEAPSLARFELSADKGSAHRTAARPSELSTEVPAQGSVVPLPEPKAQAQPLLTAGELAESIDQPQEESSHADSDPIGPGTPGRWLLESASVNEGFVQRDPVRMKPAIEWPAPDPIVYGAKLGTAQLNATTSVVGVFAYTPAAGEVLAAGTHTIRAVFTPEDSVAYATAESIVSLTVNKAMPVILWSAPSQIAYGAALSPAQLNAKASVPGTFAYKPGMGELLTPGVHKLWVDFTPDEAANYAAPQISVPLTVTLATPAIKWQAPASIAYGTALGAAQLNAVVSVPGSLSYTPRRGEVLPAGEHTLSVSFTPNDSTLYRTAGAAVALEVTKATPIVTWPIPAAITSRAPLGPAQLNASALVPGTLTYTPAAGAMLPAGQHVLSVIFTPTDSWDYTTVQASVPLTVTIDTPGIGWPASGPAAFGSIFRGADFTAAPQSAPAKAAPPPTSQSMRRAKSASGPVEQKQPIKPAAKASAKTPETPRVRSEAEPPSNTTARPQIKLASRHPGRDVTQPPAESPENALVKLDGAQAPIEVGPGLDLMGSAVLEDGTTIYLVIQPGSSGPLNSSRLVSQFLSGKGPRPGFAIKRYGPDSQDFFQSLSTTAIARRAAAPISRLIRQVARLTSGSPMAENMPEKKPGFSLKGFGRSIWSRFASPDRAPSMTRLGLAADQEKMAAPPDPAEPVMPTPPRGPAYTPSSTFPASDEGKHFMPPPSAHWDLVERSGANRRHAEPETRLYMGALYAKGDDGQWHLQESEADAAPRETQSIPLPSFTPIAGDEDFQAGFQPEFAGAAKPTRRAKPTAKKPQPKAIAKEKGRAGESQKQLAKATPKSSKAAPKPVANAPAVKPAKSAAKPPAKRSVKPEAKPAVKTSAKPATKTLAKRPARKTASAPKGLGPIRGKPARGASAPEVNLTIPQPASQEQPRETVPANHLSDLI